MDAAFDITDTWLYMGFIAAHEESEMTRYIVEKKNIGIKTAADMACVEYASEMRSSLRETKLIFTRKALAEKGGQYKLAALEKLLAWHVISAREQAVMSLRVNNTYEEIGHELGIDTSTAYRTVQRVHARVKLLYIKVSTVDVNAASDPHQMEANAKKIEEKILLAKLSTQQHEIYMLMSKGYSDDEIRLRLIISAGTYRVQKCRINKMKQYLTMV